MVERAFFVGVDKYRLDWRSCCRGERESGWRMGGEVFPERMGFQVTRGGWGGTAGPD